MEVEEVIHGPFVSRDLLNVAQAVSAIVAVVRRCSRFACRHFVRVSFGGIESCQSRQSLGHEPESWNERYEAGQHGMVDFR